MKSAFVSAFKAFTKQVRDNRLELAIKTVEKNGYEVALPKPVKVSK